jgi:hypothetical protein
MVNPLPSDMGAAVSYSGDVGLFVMRIQYNRPGPSAVPAYYLPWKPDEMMRMKLKPSPHHAKQEGGLTLDPDLFVTAALQGCTVVVTGEPAQPVVYHLNAKSVRGPGGETLGGDDAEFDIAAQAKVTHMRGKFATGQTSFPKEGPKVGGVHQPLVAPTTRGVNVTDYMKGVKPGLNTVLRDFYRRRFGATYVNVAQFGTVFGIRNGGAWKFYRQTRTRVIYRAIGATVDAKVWVDPVCVRFWP